MTEATTHTLDVPGAVLAYDIRKNDSSTEPPLMMIGLPMGAAGFGTLSGYFTDRTVITYDPRGSERSTLKEAAPESTPDIHADDVHRLIQELGGGPVDLVASSGGAVVALALVARFPGDVRTLVAHEPPDAALLPDREEAFAAVSDIQETYQRDGVGPAMVKFIAIVSHQGPIPADWANQQFADPAMFGMTSEDDGSRDDPMFGGNMVAITHYEPDFDALRAAPSQIVVAAGAESEGILAYRAALAAAERLGTQLETFPGGHNGFMGGEYGQPPGEPEAFAAKLREVLSDSAVRRERTAA